MAHLLNQVSEWNPQFFRELKGRLNPRNFALAGGVSLLAQLVVYISFLSNEPGKSILKISSRYCHLRPQYLEYEKQYSQINNQLYNAGSSGKDVGLLEVQLEKLRTQMNADCPPDAINLQLWGQEYWTDIFVWLSLIGFLTLLVVGTYMLINDLATEERRGTLNFIRLSPQSYKSIFLGKVFGVPILLYLAVLFLLPYHFVAGISANISVLEIISLYGLVIGSCAFFYSFALLLGLVSSGLGGFQAWLGSGAVLAVLSIANNKPIMQDGTDWLNFFSPSVILRYLINSPDSSYWRFPFDHGDIHQLKWFEFPLGTTGGLIVLFSLLNYGVWTFWFWQGLKRCFRNPNTTIISKQQSYWLTGCFTLLSLGFATQRFEVKYEYYAIALVWNFILFLGLIAALSPQRQTLQDWARYRRERVNKKAYLIQDLIWGDKSPAIVAITLNLLITIALFIPAIVLNAKQPFEAVTILSALLLNASLILICASLAQLMLLTRTRKQIVWAAGSIAAVIVIPLIFLAVLSAEPTSKPVPFLFSILSFLAIENTTTSSIFLAIMGQWTASILLNLQLTRKLRQAGESDSKALLASHSS